MNGSVGSWHQVNLQGEYNFAGEYLEGDFISEDRSQKTDDRGADYGCRKSDYIGIITPIIQFLLLLPLGHVLLYTLCPFCPQPATRHSSIFILLRCDTRIGAVVVDRLKIFGTY